MSSCICTGVKENRHEMMILSRTRVLLVILDEPEAGLDEFGVDRFISEVSKRCNHELTTISATHNADVLSVCDDVIVMDSGKIRFHGTFRDLIDKEIGSTTIEISTPLNMNLSAWVENLRFSLSSALKITVTRDKRLLICGKEDLKLSLQDGPLSAHKALAILRPTVARDVLLSVCGDFS